jgi:hypothetical protein
MKQGTVCLIADVFHHPHMIDDASSLVPHCQLCFSDMLVGSGDDQRVD